MRVKRLAQITSRRPGSNAGRVQRVIVPKTGDAAMPSKTREQFKRTLERKPDMPKHGDAATLGHRADTTHPPHRPEARQSEMPVSQHGLNQESRQHNKHNHPTQTGHGPQKHSPAEEGH
jgi:hypothetical protein